MVICKPSKELSPEPNYAGILILDFQPSYLSENKFLLVKLPSSWCFVMIVQDKTGPGTEILKSSPGDSSVQPKLITSALICS